MVMQKNDATLRERQLQQQAAAADRQRKEHEERERAPKRQVRLSATFREVVKLGVPGVSPAEYREVPAGQPVEVTEEEWRRLKKLNLIVETVGETARRDQPQGSSKQQAVLLGSSKQQSDVRIGAATVQLGEIVAGAHKASGKSVEEWNALPEADRELLIDAEIERRRAAQRK